MRSFFPALPILLIAASAALATETPPSIDRGEPPSTAAPAEIPPAAAGPVLPESPKERAEALLETLRTTKDPVAGKAAEKALIAVWSASGSDTVDLLMTWSSEAIGRKNLPLALDFLDQVTVMSPGFAEGWNKRATVYFLMDDYGKALADIGRALAIEPRHFGALSGLGLIFQAMDDEARAKAAYQQALEIDPFLDDVRKALDEIEASTAGATL
ncbi:MAG TPA: tetratricopeptide repeat protein [Bauldia sp.]|nr:tetratricopeptide repeat protein [Bauldia sp.]